jgi:hypothetical protein
MVSKCLNSQCSAAFKYFGRGRLFHIDYREAEIKSALTGKKVVVSIRSKINPIEHFWLCEKCATTMTIGLSDAGEVRLVPLEVPVRRPKAVPAPQTGAQRGTTAS